MAPGVVRPPWPPPSPPRLCRASIPRTWRAPSAPRRHGARRSPRVSTRPKARVHRRGSQAALGFWTARRATTPPRRPSRPDPTTTKDHPPSYTTLSDSPQAPTAARRRRDEAPVVTPVSGGDGPRPDLGPLREGGFFLWWKSGERYVARGPPTRRRIHETTPPTRGRTIVTTSTETKARRDGR